MRNRGEIWLAKLNPQRGTEPGKVRPVLVVQAQVLLDERHPSTLIVPLTNGLLDDAEPLRVRINQGEGLERESDAMIDQLRAIDNKRFVDGPLRRLGPGELGEVDQAIREVMDLEAV